MDHEVGRRMNAEGGIGNAEWRMANGQRRPQVIRSFVIRYSLLCILLLCAGASGQDNVSEPARSNTTKGDLDKEEKKLGERLVRKALAQGDDDIMSGLIRLMNEASRELDIEFNPGAFAQALQKQIMDGLDDAIKTAAAQRRRASPDQQKWRSDKRRKQRTPRQSETDKSQAEGRDSASSEGVTRSVQEPGGSGAPQRDHRIGRGWGALPPRDRDEVIQGKREESLERYRLWIERYYRALQEADE